MDVGEKDVARVADDTDVVLDVERDLEIVAPVSSVVAVVGKNRVVEEDARSVEVRAQALQHDDIGRDDEEVA